MWEISKYFLSSQTNPSFIYTKFHTVHASWYKTRHQFIWISTLARADVCREFNHFFHSVFTNLGVLLCKIIADSIKVALGIGNWALSIWCDQQTIASQCQFQMSKPTFIESAISMWIIFYETEKQSLIIIMTIITSTAQSFKRKNIILNDSPSIDNFWIPHSICPPPLPLPISLHELLFSNATGKMQSSQEHQFMQSLWANRDVTKTGNGKMKNGDKISLET